MPSQDIPQLRIPDQLPESGPYLENSSVVPAGLFRVAYQPRTASWVKFSRPFGTRFLLFKKAVLSLDCHF